MKWTEKYPIIFLEWDFDKNEKSPNDFKMVSKVWWKCEKGHSWKAKISNRIYLNRGCPYCKGSIATDNNNLEFLFPEIVKRWNYEKNKISPSLILPKSTKNMWWKCNKGHEWQASPHSMTNKKTKTGCPYCKGLLSSKENNIMDKKNLINEWDYSKNNVSPEEMTKGKGVKIWWKCEKGHEWQASIASRVKGAGCPFCRRNHSLLEIRIYSELKFFLEDVIWIDRENGIEKDVFLPNYKIAIEIDGAYWHRNKKEKDLIKNKKLEEMGIMIIRIREFPLERLSNRDIIYKYGDSHISILIKLFKFLHEITKYPSFEQYVKNGYIVNDLFYKKTVSDSAHCVKSIAEVRTDIVSEWDYPKNGFMTPENMSYGSGRIAYFKCSKGHEWGTTIKSRSAGNNCPYCSGRNPTKEHNLVSVYPESKNEWDYSLNEKLPEDYSPYSHKEVWWKYKDGESKKIKISEKVRYFIKKSDK